MLLPADVIGTSTLAKWMRFTSVHEAPRAMHFVSFLTMFSAVVERRLVIHRGYSIRAGVYTLLVGPSATRKNLPPTLAREVYIDAGLDIYWFGTNITEEGIATAFDARRKAGDSTAGSFVATEFGRIIGSKKYQDGMLRLLIDTYDGAPMWYDRRGSKEERNGDGVMRYGCENPYIVLLAASTPSDLRTLPEATLRTGLTSRFWVVCEQGKEQRNTQPEFDMDLREEIVGELKERINRVYRISAWRMRMSEEAFKLFDAWYKGPCEEYERNAPPELEPWSGKRHDHAVRAAALMQLVDGGDIHELSVESVQRGIGFIQAMEPSMAEAYGVIAETPWSARKREVIEMVKRNGAMEERHIKAGCGRKWGKGEGDALLAELLKEGALGHEPGATGRLVVK